MKSVKYLTIISLLIISFSSGYNYHGSAIINANQTRWKGWIVTIDTGFILHTPNNGIDWISQSFPTSRYFFDVFFLDTLKGWIGTDQGFIYYTDNGGDVWSLQCMGLAKHAARIFFIDSNFGWAACGGAIVGRTADGGWSWEQLILPYPPFAVDTVDLYDISFINPKKGWFCAGRYPELDNDTFHFKQGQGYIAVSNDSGINWQLQRKDTFYDFFGIKFKDSLNGIVVGGNDSTNNGVVMKTTNGGNTWSIVSIPAQAKYLRALEWVGNHLWAVGRNGTIIHSANNGANWSIQQSNVDTTLFDVDFADTLHGLIAGNGCVLYTNNGGNTWQFANVEAIEEISNLKYQTANIKLQVFPNPFRNQITIRYPLLAFDGRSPLQWTKSTKEPLRIFNVFGQPIKTFNSSNSFVIWDGKDDQNRTVPSGVYFATIKADKYLLTTPIIYQK